MMAECAFSSMNMEERCLFGSSWNLGLMLAVSLFKLCFLDQQVDDMYNFDDFYNCVCLFVCLFDLENAVEFLIFYFYKILQFDKGWYTNV